MSVHWLVCLNPCPASRCQFEPRHVQEEALAQKNHNKTISQSGGNPAVELHGHGPAGLLLEALQERLGFFQSHFLHRSGFHIVLALPTDTQAIFMSVSLKMKMQSGK